MSISENTYSISGGQRTQHVGTWLSALAGRWHRLGAYLAARRARNLELRELYRFSDRELWDVGLSRSDILAIEKGVYRRD
jgi:uncharacterized protein YjiS (DUF1127 family)